MVNINASIVKMSIILTLFYYFWLMSLQTVFIAIKCHCCKTVQCTEPYLEPSRTSTMTIFGKIVNG